MTDAGRAARTMVVTGASSGIGFALAQVAAGRGYRVVAVARRADRLETLRRSITDAGGSCVALAADVMSRESAGRIVDTALRAFGRIDVVVNNAGAGAHGALLEQSDAQLDAQWQLNVVAPLRLARAALASLGSVRGVLVFVGSGSARIPLPQWGAYASAKAALRAAAIQLRRELRPRGIAVIYVDPGLVATEFHSAIGIHRPLGLRPNTPDRIARAILLGIARRRAVVNATPLQSLGTI
ncbi:MAG: SDR family NAD(P)-dependent oxidoreductase, partial [Candidatus Eremiobacteraeota bacterium]|nr:SDR family NAD(P)-dependent oxidoreductase [Candidatus Eremiobacteraeota bacterium]